MEKRKKRKLEWKSKIDSKRLAKKRLERRRGNRLKMCIETNRVFLLKLK